MSHFLSSIGRSTTEGRGYRLSVANALWGQAGLRFRPGYVSIAEKHYDAGFREVDFARHTEEARLTINRWVEEKTENKIVDLIGPGVLDPLTRLVLTNAIYFKGQWDPAIQPGADQGGSILSIRREASRCPIHAPDREIQVRRNKQRAGIGAALQRQRACHDHSLAEARFQRVEA